MVELPVSQPTCIAFGGANLDLLFVTTAKQGLGEQTLADEPSAGDLFMYRTNCTGLASYRYR